MTEKERRLIRELKKGKPPMEAARRAGYHIRWKGDMARLLARPLVAEALDQGKKVLTKERMKEALERIAFGSVEDAVRFMDGTEQKPEEELFPVAELKRRQAGYEMKFYDRLRAMEMLERLEEGEFAKGIKSLGKILEESAFAIREHE